MAAGKAFQSKPAAFQETVLADGFVGISGTGGTEPASGRKSGRNVLLVKAIQGEKEFFHWEHLT